MQEQGSRVLAGVSLTTSPLAALSHKGVIRPIAPELPSASPLPHDPNHATFLQSRHAGSPNNYHGPILTLTALGPSSPSSWAPLDTIAYTPSKTGVRQRLSVYLLAEVPGWVPSAVAGYGGGYP